MSGIFRRTSVPGYVYGSELSGIQRSNLRAHLVDRQLAGDISLEDRLRGIGRLKSFQSYRTDRALDASLPFNPFPLCNRRDADRHKFSSRSILSRTTSVAASSARSGFA